MYHKVKKKCSKLKEVSYLKLCLTRLIHYSAELVNNSNFSYTCINYIYFKKTATAVAHCKRGKGLIKVNGCPLDLVQPETLRYKVCIILLVLSIFFYINVLHY